MIAACQAPSGPPSKADEQASSESEATDATPEPSKPEPSEEDRIPAELYDADRWIFVQKAREGTAGAWATATFNRERNKLIIRERDVQQFAIDTSRIPINWERLVVISINGRGSELRKRDYPILHFARDDHGQWVVLEP